MIARNKRSGSHRAPGRASTALPGNHHNARLGHGPFRSKISDELREYLAHQSRLVLIGVGGTARTFEFIDFRSFHAQPDSQGS